MSTAIIAATGRDQDTGGPDWLVHVCVTGLTDPAHACGVPASEHGCHAACGADLDADDYQDPGPLRQGEQWCAMCVTELARRGYRPRDI